jgi:MFS family permease
MTTRWRLAYVTALAGVAVLLLAAALAVLAGVARHVGSPLVVMALERNSATIGTALRIQLERAVSIGIGLDQVVGVEPVLHEQLTRHREVSFFALLDAQQRWIAFVASPRLTMAEQASLRRGLLQVSPDGLTQGAYRVARTPIAAGPPAEAGSPPQQGVLLIGYPLNYIDQQVDALVLDLAVAVLIAVLLVAECLRFAGQGAVWREWAGVRAFMLLSPGEVPDASGPKPGLAPDRAHCVATTRPPIDADRRLGDIARLRMVVFLVALSDELCRPFLAIHAYHLDGPLLLSNAVLAGIPLTAFLLTWAFSQPLGVGLLRRHGASACLSGAAGLTAAGLLATMATDSWYALIALRALTGFGFGGVLIFAQALLLRLGGASGRAQALAQFVAAVVAAGMCGPVIGGLLAVKFGAVLAFGVAAACALTAMFLARGLHLVEKSEGALVASGRVLSMVAVRNTVRHPALMALMVFSSIPGKLASTAVLLMLVPLYSIEMGHSPSVTGRLLLLFFMGFFLVSGVSARWSDRWNVRKPFIAIGGLVSAAACFVACALDSLWGLCALCGLLGLGQAWVASPQIVLATQLIEARGASADGEMALGLYRLVERLGGALGPVLAAALIGQWGLRGAVLGLGVLLTLGCAATAWALRHHREGVPAAGSDASPARAKGSSAVEGRA